MVEAIESVSAKDGGKLQQLSVQQVIDCSYENHGCNGGSPDEALYWLIQVLSKLIIIVYSTTIHFNCFDQWCRILLLAGESPAEFSSSPVLIKPTSTSNSKSSELLESSRHVLEPHSGLQD